MGYIREGLLSEGFLLLRFEGLIFGRAYFFGGGLLLEFFGNLPMFNCGQLKHQFSSE